MEKLKNNEERKQWLRNYKDWGIWYKDEHIGATYYRYVFDNGAQLIVDEYTTPAQGIVPEFTYGYYHLVGGPKIDQYIYHPVYDRFPDNETDLIAYLKCMQRLEVQNGKKNVKNIDSIGEMIRKGRERKGLTQEQLAFRMNVHRHTVMHWENGQADICFWDLVDICKYWISRYLFKCQINEQKGRKSNAYFIQRKGHRYKHGQSFKCICKRHRCNCEVGKRTRLNCRAL